VSWLLAIPHLIVLYILNIVSEVVALVSWFVILFTGKLPDGLANIQVMYMRYVVRTYTYIGFLREEYPPFSFNASAADPGDDPRVRVDVVPQLENRNRLTVFFRIILVIPQLIVLAILGIAAYVVLFIAFFAVLFTGRWPTGLRDFALGLMRWGIRVQAYCFLLTDQYPPFTLD
jgi:small-conductance mechanosensitive channel